MSEADTCVSWRFLSLFANKTRLESMLKVRKAHGVSLTPPPSPSTARYHISVMFGLLTCQGPLHWGPLIQLVWVFGCMSDGFGIFSQNVFWYFQPKFFLVFLAKKFFWYFQPKCQGFYSVSLEQDANLEITFVLLIRIEEYYVVQPQIIMSLYKVQKFAINKKNPYPSFYSPCHSVRVFGICIGKQQPLPYEATFYLWGNDPIHKKGTKFSIRQSLRRAQRFMPQN